MFGSVSSDIQSCWRRLVTEGTIGEVVQGRPGLQEICIRHTIGSVHTPVVSLPYHKPNNLQDSRTTFSQTDTQVAELLRSLKNLAVVGLDFGITPFCVDGLDTANGERIKTDLKAWKRHLVRVLKDSPSKEPKLLRWKVYENQRSSAVPEERELEVLPETFLY